MTDVGFVHSSIGGLLVLTQCARVGDEVVGREHGEGVVIAEHPSAAGQGVLVELAGLRRGG